MNERSNRLSRRAAVGAALTVAPLAGQWLYLKNRAGAAEPKPVVDDSIDQALARLRHVDSSLIGYEETATIDTKLTALRAIGVLDKNASLPASRQTQSLALAANGTVRMIRQGGTADIHVSGNPNCLASDGDLIFVGFRDHIEIFDFGGTRKAVWPTLPPGTLVTGIAVGVAEVYLADSGRRIIVRNDRTGKVMSEIGGLDKSRGIEGISLPSPQLRVAIAPDNTIWLNNPGRHRLENYTPHGNLERFWGEYGLDSQGFIGCCNPIDFALFGDGSFITVEKGVARLKHYLPDGRFDCFVAPPTAFSDDASAVRVAVDPDGHVFVLDSGKVHEFQRRSGGAL